MTKMQANPRLAVDAAWAAWWLGAALAGLIAVLGIQHALAGVPAVLLASSVPTVSALPPKPVSAARTTSEDPPALPAAIFIPGVPFTAQAPKGDWSLPFGEACEEASVLMAVAWARGADALSPLQAEREILGQVAFEDYAFGYHFDTSLAQTIKLFTRYYDYPNAALAYDIGPEDIKRELARGNIVLVPVAGALLANPYYASPPPYHMVVVRGYDDVAGEFIVNDPGTRRGAGFRYPSIRLWEAIHDWTGSDATVASGRTGMIVVWPQTVNSEPLDAARGRQMSSTQ